MSNMFDALTEIEIACTRMHQAKTITEIICDSFGEQVSNAYCVKVTEALAALESLLGRAIDDMSNAVSKAYDEYYASSKQGDGESELLKAVAK